MEPSEEHTIYDDDGLNYWGLTPAQQACEEADAKEGEDWLEYCRRWPGGVASGEVPESITFTHDDDIPW